MTYTSSITGLYRGTLQALVSGGCQRRSRHTINFLGATSSSFVVALGSTVYVLMLEYIILHLRDEVCNGEVRSRCSHWQRVRNPRVSTKTRQKAVQSGASSAGAARRSFDNQPNLDKDPSFWSG